MLEYLDQLDRTLFFILNEHHVWWLDQVMWYVSKMWVWIPVYVWMLFLIFKKLGWRSFLVFIFFVSLLLFITDFIAVFSIKSTVMRLRPTYHPEVMDRVKMVIDENGNFYRGGRFGFFSNHASNYFGVAVFFFLLMKPMKFWAVFLLFFWVTMIAYSRIYLGVHYPGDVIAGALYGGLAAILIHRLFVVANKKIVLKQ